MTFTLLLHGYVLSHRHRTEQAFAVLEQMRACGFIHRNLIALNENFLKTYLELNEPGVRCFPN